MNGNGRSVYIGQLPITATDEELRDLFSKFGRIQNITNKCMNGFAFIHFQEARAVQKVLVETEIRFHGQVLKIDATHFGQSTREVRKLKEEQEDRELLEKLERTKDETYVEEESHEMKELRLKREAASKAKDEELRTRRKEFETQNPQNDAEEISEMPIIKKRTPPKKREETTAVKSQGSVALKVFKFIEPTEKVEVTLQEVYHGAAHYTVQGVTKPVFTMVEFDEDEDGPFMDFNELDTSLGIPSDAVQPLVSFFDVAGVKHNHVASGVASAPLPATEPANPSLGRGRGRGRGQ
eukprot:TRINITY_DN13620_c0_g1_i1.p1 TRINITY_DN13620_c0_g1~~TRINITY_DN13620_c0_g1_i1.p1  ORF type:complete len:295 (+),score=70.30 TRINITY_DN13620_c0_g1_i1:79-963(+)